MAIAKPVLKEKEEVKEEEEEVPINIGNNFITAKPEEIVEFVKRIKKEHPELLKGVLEEEKVKEKEKVEEVPEQVIPLPVQSFVQKRKLKGKTTLKPVEVTDVSFGEKYSYDYSPSFLSAIRSRLNSIFKPLFSDTSYEFIENQSIYKPVYAYDQKSIFKPREVNKLIEDTSYEPSITQVSFEDYSPKRVGQLRYNPVVVQESYPVFEDETIGIPSTDVTLFSPESNLKIKPVTEFEINAKPKPFIVNYTYLSLLSNLMNEVTK